MDLVTDIGQNPVTYALLFILYTVIAIIIIKFGIAKNSQKPVWRNYFEFMVVPLSFFFFLGYGSQVLADAFGSSIQLEYNMHSLITVGFLAIYIIILWKTFYKITQNDAWRWFGLLVWAGLCGIILNAIFTGGQYLPFIGTFLGG